MLRGLESEAEECAWLRPDGPLTESSRGRDMAKAL